MDDSHSLPPPGLENPHTQPWHRLIHNLAYLSFIATGLLPPIIRYIAKPFLEENYWAFSAYVTQVAVLFVLLVVAAFQKPKTHHVLYPHESNAVKEFQRPWVGLWVAWFLFYVFLAAQELLHAKQLAVGSSPYWDLVMNLLNNSQTVCVVLCYVTLSFPTVKEDETPLASNDDADHVPLGLLFAVLIALTFLMAIGNWVYIAIKQPILDTQLDRGCMIFRLTSGAPLGVALALLIGSFESRNLGTSRITLATLYLYAVIQLSYAAFGGQQATVQQANIQQVSVQQISGSSKLAAGSKPTDGQAGGETQEKVVHKVVQEIFTTISLPLKLVLFGLVYSVLKTGRMLFYMREARQLYKEAPIRWEKFEAETFRPGRNAAAAASQSSARR